MIVVHWVSEHGCMVWIFLIRFVQWDSHFPSRLVFLYLSLFFFLYIFFIIICDPPTYAMTCD